MNAVAVQSRARHRVQLANARTHDGAEVLIWSDGLVEVRGPGPVTRFLPTEVWDAMFIAEWADTYTAREAWALVHWSRPEFLSRYLDRSWDRLRQ